jgi:hypothetical protein
LALLSPAIPQQQETTVSLATIRQAFDSASGSWEGCDWSVQCGKSSLQLRGLDSYQAWLESRRASGAAAEDWNLASEWLADVELKAAEAQTEGDEALEAARENDLPRALSHAQKACWIEQAAGRTAGRAPCWPQLCQAIGATMQEVQELSQNGPSGLGEQPQTVLNCIELLAKDLDRQREYSYALMCHIKQLGTRMEQLESCLRGAAAVE